MLTVSDAYLQAINADTREMPYRVKLGGSVELTQTEVPKMSLDESVSDTSGISIGTANSATLTLTLKNADPIDYDNMLVEPESGLVLPDGSTEWQPLGKFWVTDSSTNNDYKTLTLNCADGMYHLTGEYVSKLTYPSTIKEVVAELVSQTGVEFVGFENLPDIVVRKKLEGATFREAFGYAAGCCGKNARFNRKGQMEFIWYGDTGIIIERETQYLDGLTKLNTKSLNVGFEVVGAQETYNISVISDGNGGVVATPGQNVIEGETIVVSVSPYSGYELATIEAVTALGDEVTLYMEADGTGYTFIQPDSDVTITASFREGSDGPFKLTARAYEYGTIGYENSENEAGGNYFDEGDTVTLFICADSGYEIERIVTTPSAIALDEVGETDEGDIIYEFSMPRSDVTINVYFKSASAFYKINRTVDYGGEPSSPGSIYVQNTYTGELISGATEGTTVSVTFASNVGYAFDYYDSNVTLLKVGESTYNFLMPAGEVSITAHYKLSEDVTKTGRFSWLQVPSAPPTNKPYWAVLYKDDWSVPVWQRFRLVWFDTWSPTGYNTSYGKELYDIRFEGYYYCESKNTGNNPHEWDTSVWSGNGSAGSILEWEMYVDGSTYSGGGSLGNNEYCLIATNAHLFYGYSNLIFERCPEAIQSPQTSYIVDGEDVREKGSLTYWKCPDSYSTPAPAANWMIVDANGALCMIPDEYSEYVDGDSCDGLYIVFFDDISIENVGAVYDNTDEEYYVARVTNGHYCDLRADTSSADWSLYDIAEDEVLGLRSPLYGTKGISDVVGAYHFSGILVSSVDVDGLLTANGCRVCDCYSETPMMYSMRRSVASDVIPLDIENAIVSTEGDTIVISSPFVKAHGEGDTIYIVTKPAADVTISYTNPLIYEKMVSDISALIEDISYTPVKLKHRGNPALQAGDIITAPDNKGVYHTVLIMQQTLNFGGGMNSEITCPGKTEKATSFSANGPVTAQIKKEVQQSSLDLERRLAANNALVFTSLYKTISSTEAKIASIVEWQTEAGSAIATIEQTASANAAKISLVVGQNGLVNENGAVQGSVVIEAINGTSSATIKADKINLNGAVTANSYFKINTDGSMEAKSGKIGGWTIDDVSIKTGNITSGQTGTGFYIHSGSARDSWIAAKNSEGTWTFYVKKTGEFFASSGKIGGWDITAGGFGNITKSDGGIFFEYAPDSNGYFINCTSYTDDSKYFRVNPQGVVYASGAEISGTIRATSGEFSESVKIGGTEITAGKLRDLYNFATGGSGTPITKISATAGDVGGWYIGSDYMRATENSGTQMYLYAKGKSFYVNANKTAMNVFFLVIYGGGGTPIGGISTSGWQTIYT